jgi:hypothetical protein
MPGITPARVFEVLRDGTSYADWVVGTRSIRSVEDGWPAVGTALHYTVGYGPLRKDDKTVSTCYEPLDRLCLQAQAWPAGSAAIILTVEPAGDGCAVSITEHPDRGLAKTLHNPLLDLAIKLRNVETLRRLERRARA